MTFIFRQLADTYN